jgi:hypothetical protein
MYKAEDINDKLLCDLGFLTITPNKSKGNIEYMLNDSTPKFNTIIDYLYSKYPNKTWDRNMMAEAINNYITNNGKKPKHKPNKTTED